MNASFRQFLKATCISCVCLNDKSTRKHGCPVSGEAPSEAGYYTQLKTLGLKYLFGVQKATNLVMATHIGAGVVMKQGLPM